MFCCTQCKNTLNIRNNNKNVSLFKLIGLPRTQDILKLMKISNDLRSIKILGI